MSLSHSQTTRKSTLTTPTLFGLIVALGGPLLHALVIGPLLLQPQLTPVEYALVGFGVMWTLTGLVLFIVRRGEKRPLLSIGFTWPGWKWTLAAVGIGIGLSLLVPALTVLTAQLLPPPETGGLAERTAQFPPWLILLSVLTAGVTEEVLFRAYPLDRLRQLLPTTWLAALPPLLAFVLVHLPGWHLGHIIGVVLPLGIILTALYLWQRNLIIVIIAHALIDLPLVFFALGS